MFLPFVFWLSRRLLGTVDYLLEGGGDGWENGGTGNFNHCKEGDPEVDKLLSRGALKFERGKVLNKKQQDILVY